MASDDQPANMERARESKAEPEANARSGMHAAPRPVHTFWQDVEGCFAHNQHQDSTLHSREVCPVTQATTFITTSQPPRHRDVRPALAAYPWWPFNTRPFVAMGAWILRKRSSH